MSDPRHEYDPAVVEAKWRDRWVERRTNEPDLDGAARPFYNLMMFPYPSAEGLHVGNLFAFTGADVFGRFQRMQGWNVFQPMGFDAFGIHSENFALKMGIHPAELIPRNIANFTRQLRGMGGMYAMGAYWHRSHRSRLFPEVDAVDLLCSCSSVVWRTRRRARSTGAPTDKTVLSNEQVIAGACERCGTPVEQRVLEQWYFRITDYAGRLLDNLDDKSKMDWSASTTTAQKNWIGKSEGAELTFTINAPTPGHHCHGVHHEDRHLLRRDLCGAGTTNIRSIEQITTPDQRAAVVAYRAVTAAKDLVSRKIADKEKTGVFTGAYATALNGKQMPIWTSPTTS